MKVSVITLFHNRLDLSRAYLRYWREGCREPVKTELWFGDALSTDGTRDLVAEAGDLANIRLFDDNPGFAAGCNRLARESAGDILVFLNNDTLPCDGWLREILVAFESRPDVGIIGNQQLSVASRQIDHAGVFFDHLGRPFHFRPPSGALNRLRWMPVPAVTGACMAVRRELFEKLGGFNESYVNGYEDTDFCLRARPHHRDCLVATRSHVWHYIGASPGRHVWEDRNESLFLRQWSQLTLQLTKWTPPSLAKVAPQVCLPRLRHQSLQIFLPTEHGFQEQCSLHLLYPEKRWIRVRVTLPTLLSAQSYLPLRIDPSKKRGVTKIGGLSVYDTQSGALLWQARGEALSHHCLGTGTCSPLEGETWGVESTGEDPQILISLPEELTRRHTPLDLSFWIRTESRQPPVYVDGPPKASKDGKLGVLVDLWRLSPGGANGGIKVLVMEILRALAKDKGGHAMSCVIQPAMLHELLDILPFAQIIQLNEHQYQNGDHVWVTDYDVLYTPVHSSRLSHPKVRQVSLVVDLLHKDHPESLPLEEIYHRERLMVENLAASESVQCNSLFVKRALQKHYGLDNSQLFIVYNAVQHRLGGRRRRPQAPDRRPYFLYPANTWRHKNHTRLLEAYQIYRYQHDAPWDLRFTGTRVGGTCEGLPGENTLPDGCRWHGFLEEKEYFELLCRAGALVFPSLYEGFGIPVLEALQLGIPVACSRSTSLPEVGGRHVHYFDAYSSEDIAGTLLKLARGQLRHDPEPVSSLACRFNWANAIEPLRQRLLA